MTFLISTQTLAQAWGEAQDIARQLRTTAQIQKDAATAGAMPGSRILNFERDLRAVRDRFDVIAAMPGIATYVGSLANTPGGYSVTTEFSTMRVQIVASIDWVRTNFPKDSTATFLMERSWGADGPVERTFTAAQLAGYRTQLDALMAAIG